MILIDILDMPERAAETEYYYRCNQHGALDAADDKNEHDLAFEEFFRCKLILINGNWHVEFTDEEYTWFAVKWS